jgi:hypothetical protein
VVTQVVPTPWRKAVDGLPNGGSCFRPGYSIIGADPLQRHSIVEHLSAPYGHRCVYMNYGRAEALRLNASGLFPNFGCTALIRMGILQEVTATGTDQPRLKT